MSYGILYIGGIPGNFSENEVLEYFRQYTISARFTMITPTTRASAASAATHFGYLTVPAESVATIRSYQHYFGQTKVVCEEYLGDDSSSNLRNSLKRRRVFVRNVKKAISDAELHRAFSRYGTVESAFVIKDHLTGKSRSFGYVTFEQEESAFAVVAKSQLIIKGVTVFTHAFEKSMEQTLDFIQSKAEDSYQFESPSDSNSGGKYSAEIRRECYQQASSQDQKASTKRVQLPPFRLKNISPTGSGLQSHPDPTQFYPQEHFFNIRGSNHRAAAETRELYSEVTLSNETHLSHQRQSLLLKLPSARRGPTGCHPLNHEVLRSTPPHIKPTSNRYNHHAISKILEPSQNLRFNKVNGSNKRLIFRF